MSHSNELHITVEPYCGLIYLFVEEDNDRVTTSKIICLTPSEALTLAEELTESIKEEIPDCPPTKN